MRRAARILAFGTLALGWTEPAWAGDPERPAVQRPSTPAIEPVEVEPAEVEPVEVEPAPEPAIEFVAPEPAIAEPLPPAPGGGLPSYAAAPIVTDTFLAAREVPRDGRGRLVLGTAGVLGGAALFAGSIALAVDGGHEPGAWGTMLVLGAGATVTGGVLIHSGRRRLLAYREWEAQTDAVPRQGNGLVATGGTLLVLGAATGIGGSIAWMVTNMLTWYSDDDPSRIPPAVVGVGLGTIATGAVLLVVGMKRHERFQAWREGPLARMQLVPGVAPLPGGVRIGLSGRF